MRIQCSKGILIGRPYPMRPLFIILITVLLLLQQKLWLGDGNLIQLMTLQKKLHHFELEKNTLVARNMALEADIRELKSGDQALEEQARFELGMIKEDEVYYQFMN